MKTLLIHDDAKQFFRHHKRVGILKRARRMVELAQRRIANWDSREDCRELARRDLRHWRTVLMQQLNKRDD